MLNVEHALLHDRRKLLKRFLRDSVGIFLRSIVESRKKVSNMLLLLLCYSIKSNESEVTI